MKRISCTLSKSIASLIGNKNSCLEMEKKNSWRRVQIAQGITRSSGKKKINLHTQYSTRLCWVAFPIPSVPIFSLLVFFFLVEPLAICLVKYATKNTRKKQQYYHSGCRPSCTLHFHSVAPQSHPSSSAK